MNHPGATDGYGVRRKWGAVLRHGNGTAQRQTRGPRHHRLAHLALDHQGLLPLSRRAQFLKTTGLKGGPSLFPSLGLAGAPPSWTCHTDQAREKGEQTEPNTSRPDGVGQNRWRHRKALWEGAGVSRRSELPGSLQRNEEWLPPQNQGTPPRHLACQEGRPPGSSPPRKPDSGRGSHSG